MLERLHLRWQVVLCVGALQLAALAILGLVLVHNARTAVEDEMAAAEAGARAQVIAATGAALAAGSGEVAARLADHLVEPRHVRLSIVDPVRGPLPLRQIGPAAPPAAEAPDWFRRMVTPAVRETRLSIVDGTSDHGVVVLTADPSDEIAEVWRDASVLFRTLAGCLIATLAVLMVVVHQALKPLDRIKAGLTALQDGRLSTRLRDLRGPDFAPIVDGFNTLSASLEASEAARAALARKVIALGDAERRSIAMELHDEFGPCLFGLKVKAGGIARLAESRGDAALAKDAQTIGAIVDQIQTANTRLLTTLRPMPIGQLSLVEAVADMLDGFRSTHTGILWRIDLPETLPRTDEILDLTVYRFLQEGVTNALRHGQPRRIAVTVRLAPGAPAAPAGQGQTLPGAEPAGPRPAGIDLSVEDDGAGLPGQLVEGRGLTAMRDRVHAVGGSLSLSPRPGRGTRLSAFLPMVPVGAGVLETQT